MENLVHKQYLCADLPICTSHLLGHTVKLLCEALPTSPEIRYFSPGTIHVCLVRPLAPVLSISTVTVITWSHTRSSYCITDVPSQLIL